MAPFLILFSKTPYKLEQASLPTCSIPEYICTFAPSMLLT